MPQLELQLVLAKSGFCLKGQNFIFKLAHYQINREALNFQIKLFFLRTLLLYLYVQKIWIQSSH